jgi:hypothetical protein
METTGKRRGETGAKQAGAGVQTKTFKCERCQTRFRCSDTLINHLAKKKQCKKADSKTDACKSSASRLELLRAIDAKRAKDFEDGAFYQCKRCAFSTNKRNERNLHNIECRRQGSGSGSGAGAITSSTVSTVSTISPVSTSTITPVSTVSTSTVSTVSTSQLTDEQIRDRIQALQRMLVERERNEKKEAMRVTKQVPPIDFIIGEGIAQREFAAVVVKMHLGGGFDGFDDGFDDVDDVDDVADKIIRQVWTHVDHMLFSSTTSAAHIRLRERAGQAWRQPFRDAGMALADFDFDLEFDLLKKWWNDDAGPGARVQVLRVLARGGVKVVK